MKLEILKIISAENILYLYIFIPLPDYKNVLLFQQEFFSLHIKAVSVFRRKRLRLRPGRRQRSSVWRGKNIFRGRSKRGWRGKRWGKMSVLTLLFLMFSSGLVCCVPTSLTLVLSELRITFFTQIWIVFSYLEWKSANDHLSFSLPLLQYLFFNVYLSNTWWHHSTTIFWVFCLEYISKYRCSFIPSSNNKSNVAGSKAGGQMRVNCAQVRAEWTILRNR